MAVFFLFVDGVGIGEKNEVNPLASWTMGRIFLVHKL
jgi:hypothetical protein